MKTLFTTIVFCFCTIFLFAQDTIYVPTEQSTIQAGIDVAANGDLIIVDEGRYFENIDFLGKAITVASRFFIDGNEAHIQNTIIDGSQPIDSLYGSVVRFYSGEDTTSVLCGFTITGGFGIPSSGYIRTGGGIKIYNSAPKIIHNIIEFNTLYQPTGNVSGSALFIEPKYSRTSIIENNIIKNNLAKSNGNSAFVNGTITVKLFFQGSCIIRNNVISNNVLQGSYVLNGGAIDVFGENNPDYICLIENNKISENIVANGVQSEGGGIYVQNVHSIIKNNIIAKNSAKVGGGIFYRDDLTTPTYNSLVVNNTIVGNSAQSLGGGISTNELYEIVNCVIWGNKPTQFYGSSATINYSNIEESYTGVGNISLEPEFQDTIYYLFGNSSPCIDAGNPDPIYNDVEDSFNLGYPLWPAMGTLTNDMGHCGGPSSYWPNVIINSIEDDDKDNFSPDEFSLYQNYPNPFNPSTRIKYSIPQSSNIIVKVFDILGNEIETLVNEEKPAGTYELSWYSENLPSGVYFYQLKAGSFVETKKMLMLK